MLPVVSLRSRPASAVLAMEVFGANSSSVVAHKAQEQPEGEQLSEEHPDQHVHHRRCAVPGNDAVRPRTANVHNVLEADKSAHERKVSNLRKC